MNDTYILNDICDLKKKVESLELTVKYLENMIRFDEITPPKDLSELQKAKERMTKYHERSQNPNIPPDPIPKKYHSSLREFFKHEFREKSPSIEEFPITVYKLKTNEYEFFENEEELREKLKIYRKTPEIFWSSRHF